MYKYCPYCSNELINKNSTKSFQLCDNCRKYIYHHTPQTAACILLNKKNEILLIKRQNDPFKGLWSLPAGFVEYGENPIDAAMRELKEETGLDAEYDQVIGTYLADDHPKTYSILTVITVKTVKGKLLPSDDAEETNFFKLNELPEMAFKAQVVAIKNYVKLSDIL